MVEGVRKPSVANGLISEADFDRGIADLHRTAEIDGVFCCTFFMAVGIKLEGEREKELRESVSISSCD
jgi:hypothetical protein